MNSRLWAVLFLGFSSGLPLALTSSTLQAWMTEDQVSLAAIGALSLIGIPYTLKFIWAPLLDYIKVPLFGLRRGWILLTQIALVILLVLLAGSEPAENAQRIYIIAIMIAFFSATQDVAIDAYRADVLKPKERGLGAACSVFSYRVALLISGGFALVLADRYGWQVTYYFMAACIALSMIAAYFAPASHERIVTGSLFQATKEGIADILKRDRIIVLLLFLMLYKAGDALALQLMTNFLLHGLGFTLTEVGLAYKIVSFVATIAGGFVGGLILTRLSVFRGLLYFGILQAFSNFMFVLLALVGKSFAMMASAIFIENFCSGLSTAALIAFMMSLCDHKHTASQFAVLSAVASLGRVFLGPLAAALVAQLGWVEFYTWTVILSFPGLILLMLLKKEVGSYAVLAAD